MSRNIPDVKRWYFRYYNANGGMIYIAAVSAPTKLLARLVARDQMFGNGKWLNAFLDAERVTISLREPTTEQEIER